MYDIQVTGRSWVEIDLGQLGRNYEIFKKSRSRDCEVMAVVKADAYGHGDVEVSRTLNGMGVRQFAVSNVLEAITLRRAGIEGEILVLGFTPVEMASCLVEYDITQTLISERYASELLSAPGAHTIKCQFAVDTGMNRIGLDADNTAECERVIREYAPKCRLNGLFTHLCVAESTDDDNIAFTVGQVEKFRRVVQSVDDLRLPYLHCLNSAGAMYFSDVCRGFESIVRLGIVLYGLKPDFSSVLPDGIKPVLRWKTVVSMVKEIDGGEYVGYGRSFRAPGKMLIATLPTGYADGYSRLLSNCGCVYIRGMRAPVVGRVCMDQMTVDVSDIDGVRDGDEVELIGEHFGADDMARLIGSIGYEVVCNISKRVARIYKNGQSL